MSGRICFGVIRIPRLLHKRISSGTRATGIRSFDDQWLTAWELIPRRVPTYTGPPSFFIMSRVFMGGDDSITFKNNLTGMKVLLSSAPLISKQGENSMAGAKRTEPTVPASHPDFKWSAGADVQATWKRFGWKPSGREPVYTEPEVKSSPVTFFRRKA